MSLVYLVRFQGLTLEETRAKIAVRLTHARCHDEDDLFEALADVGEFNRAYPRATIEDEPLRVRVTIVGELPAWPR
ncbi:MAG: hypothetical protein NVSMB19_23130 [Vulcanimicrobiaceae bacterium]